MDNFHEAFEGLKQTADGLILANQGIKRAADAVLQARPEHDDLRETVQRLEQLVLTQTTQIHELRADVQRLREGRDNRTPRA